MYSTRFIWFYDIKDQIRWTYEDIFYTDESECRLEKGLLGLFCGLLLGTATFIAFKFSLEFSFLISAIVGGSGGLILALALAFNTFSRAVVSLCMPTLFLKSGRLVVSTVIFSLLLTGPITNFSNNATELASTHACNGELLYNETQALREFIREPFVEFRNQMQRELDKIENGLKVFVKVYEGIKAIEEFFVDGRNNLREWIRDRLLGDALDISVDPIPSREELVQEIKDDIASKIKIADTILLYFSRALSLSVLIIVIQSAFYLRKYRQYNIDFDDNQYITTDFVQVDAHRKQEGKTSVLPLAPKEKQLVTDRRQKTMSILERKALLSSIITGFVTVALGGIVIVVGDVLLYHFILFLREHGKFRIEIDLHGMVEVIKKFNDKRVVSVDATDSKVIDTSHCLPVGSAPDYSHNIGIGAAYLVLLMMVFLQAYMLRLRRLIASYFYPQAEQKKVAALYRKLLQERVLTLIKIQDDLIEKKTRKEAKPAKVAPGNAFQRCLSKAKQLRTLILSDKCYICQSKETKENPLQKCENCDESICEECKTIMLKKSTCPCSNEQKHLYDAAEYRDQKTWTNS